MLRNWVVQYKGRQNTSKECAGPTLACMKVTGGTFSKGLFIRDIVLVCGLAKKRGFPSVVRQLEGFCFRISQERHDKGFWSRFLAERARMKSDLYYLYRVVIMDAKFFSESVQIGIELISGVWLVSFLVKLHFSDGLEITEGVEELEMTFGE